MKYMKFKAFGFKNEKKTTKEFILFVNMCREEHQYSGTQGARLTAGAFPLYIFFM